MISQVPVACYTPKESKWEKFHGALVLQGSGKEKPPGPTTDPPPKGGCPAASCLGATAGCRVVDRQTDRWTDVHPSVSMQLPGDPVSVREDRVSAGSG